MKCSWENVILRGICHVVSGFPLHFMIYIAEIWITFGTVYRLIYHFVFFKILSFYSKSDSKVQTTEL